MQKAEEETSFNYHKKKVLKLSPVGLYMFFTLLSQMFMNWRCPHYTVHIIVSMCLINLFYWKKKLGFRLV